MGTPLVLVHKKDANLRLRGNYRSTVNAATEKSGYPLPTTTEVFATLRGGTVFSAPDLYQAYQQVPVTESTAEVLIINTLKVLYFVRRLPFGITAGQETFQRMMETTLAGIPGINVYLDDVIVSGATLQEHATRLKEALRRLETARLRLRKDVGRIEKHLDAFEFDVLFPVVRTIHVCDDCQQQDSVYSPHVSICTRMWK